MKRFYKNFIIDIIIAVVSLTLGILVLPPFGIGQKFLNLLCAGILCAYLALYLFGKTKRAKGRIFILRICEFTVISIIALGLVLQQFEVFHIYGGVCAILGAVLWLRGVSSILGMYITMTNTTKTRYSLPKFIGCIAIMTLGTFFFAKPVITDDALTWILSVILFILTLCFAGLAVLFAPVRQSEKKPKKEKKVKKSKEK